MRQYLAKILAESGTLSVQDIILHILAAALLSFAIYLSYWYTHTGTAYSKKFNVSLATLTILTGTVMTVIGNNIALSLGMVGALSIVRFRTAIKDSRDTTYINTTVDRVELIYEMPRKVWQLNYKKSVDIADALYALGDVEYVNTVAQSDEISG